MTQPQLPERFADIAVELGVAQSFGDVDLAELTWATWVQTAFGSDRARKLEVLAARVGLSADATANVLAAERRHVERIAQAHILFKRLIPHEAEVRAILERAEREPEPAVWKRLRGRLVAFICQRRRRA